MIRGVFWGLAAFGSAVAGLVLAVLTIGVIEGWQLVPDWLSQLVGIIIAVTFTWTAGLLCERAPGRSVAVAVGVVPVIIGGLGLLLMERTEGHGKGLSPTYIAGAVVVSTALIGGAAFVARRTAASAG